MKHTKRNRKESKSELKPSNDEALLEIKLKIN